MDGSRRHQNQAPQEPASRLVPSTPTPRTAWSALSGRPPPRWASRPSALCSNLPQARCITRSRSMLKAYLPVLVFLALGVGVGSLLGASNRFLGPRPRVPKVRGEPYECGLPSEVQKNFRFGVSFYLTAMLFILFDIEVVFLYPVALQLDALGTFALV